MAQSLYERLGGADGIRSMVDAAIAGHLRNANPGVAKRFADAPDLEHSAAMAADFFAAGSGGPQVYTGKDMPAAHAGMQISDEEYDAVVDDIMAAGDAHKLDDATKGEVMGILQSLRPSIVGQ